MTENSYPITANRPQIQAADVNVVSMMFDPVIFGQVMTIAETLAKGRVSVPDHIRGNVGDCLAIVMQSASWRLNPFAVAQKTHLIHGRLGYEAQLVSAVVSSLRIIKGRFSYEYVGDWDKLAKPPIIRKSSKGFEIPTPGWKPEDETGLALIVSAKIRGEPEAKKHKLTLASVWPRNPTLWATNPSQQAAYLATKQWVRKYTPDAILGVYTTDELEMQSVMEDACEPETEFSTQWFKDRIAKATSLQQLHELSELMYQHDSDTSELVSLWKKRIEKIGKQPSDSQPEASKERDMAVDSPAISEEKPKAEAWPKKIDGYIVDARGVVWDSLAHSSGQVCTQEGNWRRRRGIMPSQMKELEKTIAQMRQQQMEADAEKTEDLPIQAETSLEQMDTTETPETSETTNEMFSESWFREKIAQAKTKDDIEEYLDLLNECELPEDVMTDLEKTLAEHPANN